MKKLIRIILTAVALRRFVNKQVIKLSLIFLIVFIYSNVGQAQTYQDVQIPMRDGKFLAADVYLPNTVGTYPTILIQTPYNKNWYRLVGLPLQTMDYAFVIIDWRGFYGSRSARNSSAKPGEDGYDCVEWIPTQSWSNGAVGTWGASALADIQFKTAREHPPHLICGVPLVNDYIFAYTDFFPGGVYRTERVQMLDILGFDLSPLLLAHPYFDGTWILSELLTDYPDEIDIPMFLIGGWYDHHIDAMLNAFEDLKTIGGTGGRDHHKLLVGPWEHLSIGDTIQGALSYPEGAGVSDSLALAFFDCWLRGIPNGFDNRPDIEYFQMGSNVWKTEDNWPPDKANEKLFYLAPGGLLSENIPVETAPIDSFAYDPRDPSPTIGGPTIHALSPFNLLQGPQDQSIEVESRSDIAIFTSPVLQTDLHIAGKLKVNLHVSSDRLDTDFAIRITDVYPDGRSMLIADGIHRMRFRNGFRKTDEQLMTPGTIYSVEILSQNTAITILAGHRLRLDITSSNYPRFDNNLNNGDSMYQAGDTLIAHNKIHYGANYPSALSVITIDSPQRVDNRTAVLPEDFRLEQNFPNPFNPATTISYQLSAVSSVNLSIYNLLAQKIRTIVNERQLPDSYQVKWDGKNEAGMPVVSGVYIYRLQSGIGVQTKKMILMK